MFREKIEKNGSLLRVTIEMDTGHGLWAYLSLKFVSFFHLFIYALTEVYIHVAASSTCI